MEKIEKIIRTDEYIRIELPIGGIVSAATMLEFLAHGLKNGITEVGFYYDTDTGLILFDMEKDKPDE